MPWTLSHPAAILPLRRLTPVPLDFAALVVGSMTPDVGYYIRRFDLSQFAHSLPGSFLACLPTGMIMLCVFYFFCRPVCYSLPSPHRENLFPLCPEFPTGLTRWAILLVSLLLGTWTHLFWDAFTHEDGWFVVRIPWLQEPVMQLGSTMIFMYLLMQELSTLVGFAILLLAYRSWLRRQPALDHLPDADSNRMRYVFWIVLLGLSLAVSFPPAVQFASSTHLQGFLFGRCVVFRTAIYSHALVVPIVLLGTSILYRRRDR